MAQTGDPTGTGTGGSDLPNLPAEFTQGALQARHASAWRARGRPNSRQLAVLHLLRGLRARSPASTRSSARSSRGMDVVDKIKKGNQGQQRPGLGAGQDRQDAARRRRALTAGAKAPSQRPPAGAPSRPRPLRLSGGPIGRRDIMRDHERAPTRRETLQMMGGAIAAGAATMTKARAQAPSIKPANDDVFIVVDVQIRLSARRRARGEGRRPGHRRRSTPSPSASPMSS